MADFFREQGLRAVAVHSGDTSAPRAQSLDQLSAGQLDVICAVDMFNEGVDLPELDTVLMLRPTESRILWLQQFGRGLRKTTDDKRLTVIDYIGNHRSFLLKPQTLFGLPATSESVIGIIENASHGPNAGSSLVRRRSPVRRSHTTSTGRSRNVELRKRYRSWSPRWTTIR